MRTFVELCAKWLGGSTSAVCTYYNQSILVPYTAQNRYYHNLTHITSTIKTLEETTHKTGSLSSHSLLACELALWFHDVVYDPKRSDNELLSAHELMVFVDTCDFDDMMFDTCVSAYHAIMATKHDGSARGVIGKYVVDADLSILGADETVFDQYERCVREEYAWAPDEAWVPGRTKMLEGFRKRERIYHTPEFIARFEEPARANLARSLRRLERGEVLKLKGCTDPGSGT